MTELLHERIAAHARATPCKPAIVWYGREITYAALDRLIDGCAALLARLGVGKGDRVALFMQNCPQYIVAHFGIQKLGAVVCPCSPLYKAHELAYQLGDLQPKAVIAADDLHPVVREVAREVSVGHVLLVHYADLLPAAPTYPVPEQLLAPRTIDDPAQDFLARIGEEGAAPLPAVIAPDDVALLVYTSGTTGRPKGAMLSHRNVMFKTAGTVRFMDIRPSDVHLSIPPLYHISGMLCGFDIPLHAGGTLVLHYRFDAAAALASIEAHRVTYWKSIAPMLVACMELETPRPYDLRSLRITTATSFGVRATAEMSRRWAEFSGGCEVSESGYGLTETHTFDAVMPRDAVKWGPAGKLVPGVRCRIVDPATGRDQPPGAQGEIVLHSPGNFLGYWRQPEKTLETLRNGWVYTGDIGSLDADGYLTWLGRYKELIKVSGYSVFPEDVEVLLMKHPLVERAAVLGVPHESKGEVVNAFVVPRGPAGDGLDEQALIAWCRQNMAAYKVPQRIRFRASLPMTASGKVIRGELQRSIA
ncbi:MAG TPA: AMP-binding protein [Ramlibacter sp.]|uniref:AMP-binding protein n=1 Tax=Ramlibacter sp. TaxID=1917967 RepID=UPI002D805BCC|nr:AMP-binding protein [Ramlibacter sp.]HET8747293.1 AMP-binding protein [Ramlibacter sp.]